VQPLYRHLGRGGALGAAGLGDFLQAGFAALANKGNELEERLIQ